MIMDLFKSNRDLDSTIMTLGYLLILALHIFLVYKSKEYGDGTAADRIGELLYAWGIATVGFLFGRRAGQQSDSNGSINEKEQKDE